MKTLKDIEFEPKYISEAYIFQELRKSAKEWIKDLQDRPLEEGNWFKKYSYPVCEWIKHFFNLKEDDLE